jgi:nucleotide-binding universal stress UspA family protein
MKLLIAYDGSPYGDAALSDLKRAGLPSDAEVLVISVAEVWVVEQPEFHGDASEAIAEQELSDHSKKLIGHAREMAAKATDHIRKDFPGWKISQRVYCDSPAWGILHIADEWSPDLIAVGSHGRGAIGRVVMGSVSQKVLTEASCSVRIARDSVPVEDAPLRILVGVDGTPDSEEAVEEVARRAWPEGTSVLVVSALGEMFIPPAMLGTDFSDWFEEGGARKMLEKASSEAVSTLERSGLLASASIRNGAPAPTLLQTASDWGADMIFIGARGHRYLERFLLGSVSSAVATRADCSVEVVRKSKEE